ncbi:30S ribosomal protein S4 [Candidatus Gribaldobacteria bacterium]|nr:30S ribosomal protein S4 [Candidatus Gribaldobacteria bacterium]
MQKSIKQETKNTFMNNTKCKICRRNIQKLFLKGDKCSSPKCPLVKRPFPPGPPRKKVRGTLSEYGKELREKQKLQKHYYLRERQFSNYVKEVMQERGTEKDATLLLLEKLEKRLDNVVFRAGFAKSRKSARQLVNHSHFLVNSKPVDIPSFLVKKGMVISLKVNKIKKPIFKEIIPILKNHQSPNWLKVNKDKFEVEVASDPLVDQAALAVDISAIFEFYSR